MKVLVCGDRNWTDEAKIKKRLKKFKDPITVIQGGARGADSLAGVVASNLGFDVVEVPAEWETYGRAAGPIRNQVMLDMDPDLVIAFHSDLDNSKGTADMVRRSRKKGIAVEVVE